jgi:integrase
LEITKVADPPHPSWPTFEAWFIDFIRENGVGSRNRNVHHVTHFLNYIVEQQNGELHLGGLREFLEHLLSEATCYYCSPTHRAARSKKAQRFINQKTKVGMYTATRAKIIIQKFLKKHDPELVSALKEASWARSIQEPEPDIFRQRMNEEEFERQLKTNILDTLFLKDSTWVNARQMSFWLQFQFALGFAELAALQVSDINLEERILTLRRVKSRLKRSFPIILYDDKQVSRLKRWLEIREKTLEEFRADFPELLFMYSPVAKFIEPWSYRAYQKWVKKLIAGTRFDKPGIGAHEIRRWGAANLYYDRDWKILDVSRLLGHKSVETTQIYVGYDVEDLRERVLGKTRKKE